MQRVKETFQFGATGVSIEKPLFENGVITHYTLSCPNFTNAVTTTLSIKDSDGTTIWTGNAHNENNSYLVANLSIPVDAGFSLVATLSGVAGGTGGNVVAAVFVDTRN